MTGFGVRGHDRWRSLHAKTGLDLKSAGEGVAMAFPSGALGACLVQFVDAKALDVPIPIIVGGIALYFALPLLWNPSFSSCPLAADGARSSSTPAGILRRSRSSALNGSKLTSCSRS
ncbi:hypothetical protein [Rhodoblastus acidophilus]|uniref:hypothetical protein n=1 Tax=Rhodoblastus acidophilus TaxID=1074 RepID=UPI002224A4F9|nr:hypothetical protein [Rhodoblastus acidophilus]